MKKLILLAGSLFLLSGLFCTVTAATPEQAEDYDLNKITRTVKNSQRFQGLVTREEASVITGARGHAALLRSVASDLQKVPGILDLLTKHKISPNFQLLAEALFSIKQDGGLVTLDPKQIPVLEVSVAATPLLPNLKQALQSKTLDATRLNLLARLSQNEADLLVFIEKKLPDALNPPAAATSAAGISIAKETGELQAIALCRQAMEALWFNRNEANIPELIRNMQKAAELDPENPVSLYLLAESRLRGGKSSFAIDALSKALKLDPGFSEALALRATTYLGLQLTTQALADFDLLIKKEESNPAYYLGRGSTWLIEKDFTNMCADFKQACELGDCSAYTWAKKRNYCP